MTNLSLPSAIPRQPRFRGTHSLFGPCHGFLGELQRRDLYRDCGLRATSVTSIRKCSRIRKLRWNAVSNRSGAPLTAKPSFRVSNPVQPNN